MPKKASPLLSGFSGSGAEKQMITSVRPSVREERETGEREITTLVFAHFIITEGRQKEAALHVIELGHLKMGMEGHHCQVSSTLQIRYKYLLHITSVKQIFSFQIGFLWPDTVD